MANLTAYLKHGKSGGPYLTESVEVKEAPMAHHMRGLSYTASGYGVRIPTPYMVKVERRWRRVYCCIFSNSGTLYIGRRPDHIIVDIDHE